MKIQISFDITDLDRALEVARLVEPQADIFEIGSLLIYKYGEHAVKRFREEFPQKTLLADAKIVDRSKDAVALFAQAGADWITVMAGISRGIIHTACTTAHSMGKKVMLDLSDSSSLGQSALEAKSLGVDALFFYKPTTPDDQVPFLDRWEMVKGNTQLPIFIGGTITRKNVSETLSLGAAGIVIGSSIIEAENIQEEMESFATTIKNL
ncbi:orotidine 5'-phosphate decarboxylase [Candidatus Dependentiae bacterium]|nr:orotidine 5'-phosphate decarboxylase [Candidatus Dependentiae bacterium]